ncbi:hypothetical protein F383_05638 [Gossypium arboreum]|uniref:Uncharacterized protein n=1 Tax=Gossypium arboreum TaxID=29729 RepID=A0A0B0P598_GOSAR|nr:hypothetical protein F383_05638 [Gossypium arboreum]
MNNYVNVYLIQVRMNCLWNLAMKGEYEYDLLIYIKATGSSGIIEDHHHTIEFYF